MPIPQLKKSHHDDDSSAESRRFTKGWRELRHTPPPPKDNDDPPQREPGHETVVSRNIFAAMKNQAKRLLPRFRDGNWKRNLVKFWIPIAGIVALLGVLSIIVVFAWYSRDLPDPNKISERNVAQSTRIYARDGKTLLYEIHGDQRRTVVELSDIAPDLIHGTIAIEDKDFYKHGGFSLTGIVRSIWRDVTTGSASEGGSTITQQFVKNAVLTNEKRISRKIRELVLSYQIERHFSKDQILKLYFNEIPYGSNAYGIEAAAETYFGKPAKSLTLAESAVLAALPQAPTHYSPYGNHTDELVSRSHYVLDLMAEQGFITREQADAAKQVDVLKSVKPKRENIIAPHFVFYVRDLLAQKYGEKIVEQGGLKVITTLDIDKQAAAEKAIADYGSSNQKKYKAENAALVSIDPKTGQVLAMVGSRDYFDTSIDGNVNVALTLQQPGSSIKPIVYATAFSRGFTPDTMLFDLRTHFKVSGGPDYVPQNFDGKDHGPVTMRKALAGSLNIPAVKTLYLAGIDNVIDQAHAMGYSTWNDRSRLGLSLTLGGADVTLLDHTSAFGSFATDGVLHTTTPILKVEDKAGKILEEFKDTNKRVLDTNIAREINDILSDNASRSFIFGSRSPLVLPDRSVAAKTGTTQEFRDAWTVGFTPSLVTGVWSGNNQNEPMKAGADGVIVAAPIWNAYMRLALAGTKAESFAKPTAPKTTKPVLQGKLEGEAPINIDKVTGKRIPDDCLAQWPKAFIQQKTVRAVHTILYYVDPADPTGPPPTNPEKNPQFSSWDAPVQEWAKKNGYVESVPPKESCDLRTGTISVSFTGPSDNQVVSGSDLSVSVAVSSPRPVVSVQFFLDGTAATPAGQNATSASFGLQGVSNGFHVLKAVVTDDVQNSASVSININVQQSTSASIIYFLSPSGAGSVNSGEALQVRAYAADPSGISSLSFSFLSPNGSSSLIATASIGVDGIGEASWTAPAETGDYRLFVKATTNSGATLQSDYLSMRVL